MSYQLDTFPQQRIESNEIPQGLVPVFVTVPKDLLPIIIEEGLRVDKNRMKDHFPKLHELFSAVAKEMNIGFDRTTCIYAYPKFEDIDAGKGFDPDEDVLLEVQVDPNERMLVADGETFVDAIRVSGKRYWGEYEENPEEYARAYYEEAVNLQDYIKDQEKPPDERSISFRSPEVLIPFDIPKERIRVIM